MMAAWNPQCYKPKAVAPPESDVASNTDLDPSDILSLDSDDMEEEDACSAGTMKNSNLWKETLPSHASVSNKQEDQSPNDPQDDWTDAFGGQNLLFDTENLHLNEGKSGQPS